MNERNSFSDLLERLLGNQFWRGVMVVLMLPCLGMVVYRRTALSDADYLGGRPEIQRFFNVNLCCFIVTAVILALEVFLFYKLCVDKENSGMKMLAFVGSMIVVFVTVAIFGYSVINIGHDLHGTTKAELDDYVLSTSGGEYFLGFFDSGENAQMPITQSLYEELSAGSKRTDGLHSNICDMITQSGYDDVTEYQSGLTVEYYFIVNVINNSTLTN